MSSLSYITLCNGKGNIDPYIMVFNNHLSIILQVQEHVQYRIRKQKNSVLVRIFISLCVSMLFIG